MWLITKDSVPSIVELEAGGKASNLYFLSKHGLPVPEWLAIGPSVFLKFIEENNLREKINELLKGNDYKKASEQISRLISESSLSGNVERFLKEAYKKINRPLIAVRSSAIGEDSATHSFAGQLSSYLYIKTEDRAIQAVKDCWASAFSERSLVYRVENKLDLFNIKVAVILQEMICSQKSGVLFTADPLKKNPDQLVINSVYGVGEGLVSGLLDADTFTMSKTKFELISEEIVTKDKQLLQDEENQTCKEVDVPEHLREISSLTELEKKELAQLGKKVEGLYHYPQDIEWAILNGKIYLLQSRPITTEIRNGEGTLFIWDNSNIVESYGGLTMPLTFGFAHYVYHQVYVQFCEVLMVPQKNIKEMDYFLKNMLGIFYGRVYYNLLNWYKLTSILPGYKFNRQFMETMMGTNESLGDEIAERVKPPAFQNNFKSKVRKFFTGFKFFYFHLNIQNIVDKFLRDFHVVYDQYRKKDYANMSSSDIYQLYRGLERDMLWKWHAPIINDFLCMVHYGIFKKLTEKWLSHLGPAFHNDLLAGNGNLESAEPTRRLIVLAGKVSANPELKELILNTSQDYCLEAINHPAYKEFHDEVKDYFDRYGFRCMSEMKLEQKDLHQDPSLFFVFLKNLINSGQTDLHTFEVREKEIREKAEKLLSESLSGVKKLAYRWSLKHARKAVMNRENTRFCRTRIYGVVRAMFYGIGREFAARNIIDKKEDIFYLTLAELEGNFEGVCPVQNFRPLIEMRKAEYEKYKDMEPAARFMTRGPVYFQNEHFPVEEEVEIDLSTLKENQMKGLGCSPGIVEGVVKVILSPEDDLTLNGEILVTHRTDPGWIPLYPSAKGLLVERGGLLSHSAIVAREMGLPTIVSVKGLTKRLKTGMKIRFDGETGLIEILEE